MLRKINLDLIMTTLYECDNSWFSNLPHRIIWLINSWVFKPKIDRFWDRAGGLTVNLGFPIGACDGAPPAWLWDRWGDGLCPLLAGVRLVTSVDSPPWLVEWLSAFVVCQVWHLLTGVLAVPCGWCCGCFSGVEEVILNQWLLEMDVVEDVIQEGCGEVGVSWFEVLLDESLP